MAKKVVVIFFFIKQRGTVLSDQDCTIIPPDFSIRHSSASTLCSTPMVWNKFDDPASLRQQRNTEFLILEAKITDYF